MSAQRTSEVDPTFNVSRKIISTGNSVIGKENTLKSFVDDLCTFTGETSLHGIRFVGNKSIRIARRCFWSILVTSALCTLGYLLRKSVVYYQSLPVATKISIDRNSEVGFPAVTFCNYNQFRKSRMTPDEKALLHGYHNDISSNYSQINDWNMTEIFYRSSHPIEDMLLLCLWKTISPCGPENFTTQIYDFGVCYTFNGIANDITLNVSNAGVSSGLILLININETENTGDRYGIAGIKMMVHPSNERPLVQAFGFSIAPGFHADVALRNVQVKYYRFVSDDDVKCDCPVACDHTAYHSRISTALWPDTTAIKRLEKTHGYTKEYIRENILQVRIYFEDLDVEVTELVSSYSGIQLLSEIGGNMGLLCGMSLITLVEFVDFAFFSLMQRIFGNKKKIRPTTK
ncbi:acid-sensing ion channel 1-like [Anneissia japonica]|uniref:acid-sensing ion channel 1-like n=1 Tax=Anneissia japonica TaxID=1529436 RepID=UPI0014258F0F|nr:acid-sensing ion channel 1-like [Anneissia japonica]